MQIQTIPTILHNVPLLSFHIDCMYRVRKLILVLWLSYEFSLSILEANITKITRWKSLVTEYTFRQVRCSSTGNERNQTCSHCLQTLRNRYKSAGNFLYAEVEMPVLYGGFKLNVSVS